MSAPSPPSSPWRLPKILALLLAFGAGALVFGNYFWEIPLLAGATQFLLKIVVLLSGAALLLATFNLAGRHAVRVRQKDVGSFLLLLGFFVALGAGLAPAGFRGGPGRWLYQWLLAPGMAALFALLPIFLAYSLFRHLSVRDVGGFLLFMGLVVVLTGQIPTLSLRFPILAGFRHFLLIGPVAAAFRGVILGAAIGGILAIFLKLLPAAGSKGRPDDEVGP